MMLPIIAAGVLAGAAAPGSEARDAAAFIRSDLHLTRYKTASVDLNGDGVPEVLVYADGPEDCGSGGCDLFVLSKGSRGYRRVTKVSVARLPVRVMPTSSHGWRDLGVEVAGGGITRGYEARLTFDGRTYPTNPTIAPATPLRKAAGRVVLE